MISLVTVVRNEEARIGKMLDWHQPWVDEVIVVHDGPCEDQTKNIVTQRKCVYYERPYTGYCEPHRAAGTAWSHGDWILFVDADEMFPIQVGAMNTGVCATSGAIDELRISRGPRYKSDFTPAKRFEVDADTSALFHFDGDLEGKCGEDGKTITAEAGTAG